MASRWRRLLPGLWLGMLLCVALIAAPAAFAVLPQADAGRVVARIFVQEAWLSLGLAGALLMLESAAPRACTGQAVDTGRGPRLGNAPLLWGSVLCTLVGYFGVQLLLPAARAGQAALSFGQLHLLSTAFFALKAVLVLVLAWRAARTPQSINPAPSS
jgi:hypothetical protein